MTKYRKQPVPGKRATPIEDAASGNAEDRDLCEQLKTTYTLERRLFEARLGKSAKHPYSPHPRYEGKVTEVTIEDRKQRVKHTSNWETSQKKITRLSLKNPNLK